MNLHTICCSLLLTVGVSRELICCLGVLRARTVFNRLHYLGPATVVCPLGIAGAVIASGAQWQSDVKAALVALVLMISSPILTHATARAARLREWGDLKPRPEDRP